MDVREHVHSHASSCSQVSAESFFSLLPSGDFTKPFGMPRYLREQSLLHYATSHVWTHEWRNRVTSRVGGGATTRSIHMCLHSVSGPVLDENGGCDKDCEVCPTWSWTT